MSEGASIFTHQDREETFWIDWINRVLSSLICRPLVYALIMCMLGSYCGFYFSSPLRFGFLPVVSLLTLVFGCKNRGCRKYTLTLVVGLGIFILSFIYFTHVCYQAEHLENVENYEGKCMVCSRNGYLSGYKNLTVRLPDGEKVNWLTDSSYGFGDELIVKARIQTIQSKGNPGDVNYKESFRNAGIFRAMKVEKVMSVTPGDLSIIDKGFILGAKIREGCFSLWNKYADNMTAMFLAAMVVGDTSHLDESVKERFKECNLFHLLVVSGAHVGYFTSTIAALFSFLSRKKILRTIVLGIALLWFGFVIGWSSSATRSILTFLCVSALSFEKRGIDRISACAFSGLVLCMGNPYSVFSQGLLLSFGATFSIMVFEKRITFFIRNRIHKIPEELVRAFSCYICANIGMLPVLISIGNTQSVLKLLVVLLAGFPAELICSLGLLSTVLAWFMPWGCVNTIMFFPIRGLVSFLDLLSFWGQKRSFFQFSWQNLSSVSMGLFVSLLLYCVCRSGIRKRMMILICLVTSLVTVFETFLFRMNDPVKVYFLDVGQGDCALICYGDKHVLIDGGNVGKGETIRSVMNFLDIGSIDLALASHLDADHIAGLLEIYNLGLIEQMYSPFWSESAEMKQLEQTVENVPEHVDVLTAGDEILIDEDIIFHVVWPKTAVNGGNEDSMVVWAEIQGTNILFTGDIGEKTENKVIDSLPEEIDILKIPHHGSRYSVSDDFYNSKKIGAAVISVGYNLYGHPSREVLEMLENKKVPCYRTDVAGCVVLEIDQSGWTVDYYFS